MAFPGSVGVLDLALAGPFPSTSSDPVEKPLLL